MEKKYNLLLLLLLGALLLTACATNQVQQPTVPTAPTDPAPVYAYTVTPVSAPMVESLVADYAEGYFADTLKLPENQGVYTSVDTQLLGQIFLDPASLKATTMDESEELYLTVAEGTYTRADGTTKTERTYFLMAWTGGNFQCLTQLSDEDIAASFADPAYSALPDACTAAAVAGWDAYEKKQQEYWEMLQNPDYFVLKNENTGEVLRNMRTLLTDRLREEGQAFRKGYFILTDLSSGQTYRKTSGAMFQFHKDDYLELDWQNAVSDGSGLYADATLTVQLENADGSWYMKLYNGKDANWVYISEAELYVPVHWSGSYEKAAEQINETMSIDYERFLWEGLYIDNYGSLSAEDAVRLYLEGLVEARELAEEACTGGHICFGEADVEDVEWSMREGRIKISCTIVYSKEDGEEFYINYWVDPYATRHSHTATLVRGSDGLWRKN